MHKPGDTMEEIEKVSEISKPRKDKIVQIGFDILEKSDNTDELITNVMKRKDLHDLEKGFILFATGRFVEHKNKTTDMLNSILGKKSD